MIETILRKRAAPGEKKRWLDTVALTWESDECLLFPFPFERGMYGNFQDAERNTFRAHVYICMKAHGVPPSNAHEVAHSCGHRPCVNKRHLRWATRTENMADTLTHGTHNRGERCGASLLTSDDVVAIRKAIFNGVLQREIGRQFGVTAQTISAIKNRRSWSWL